MKIRKKCAKWKGEGRKGKEVEVGWRYEGMKGSLLLCHAQGLSSTAR
jgi:hypothetical protein